MNDAPRYVTLRDYLRVLRDQRILVVLATLLCGGAALVVSIKQPPEYEAQASLSFRDPNVDLGDLGAAVPVTQAPEQRAAVGAQRVTDTDIAERAKRILRSPRSAGALLSSLDVQAEARTNLVVVKAKAGSGGEARSLANAFADAAAAVTREKARRRYRRIATSLRKQVLSLPPTAANSFTRSATEDRVARLLYLAGAANPVVVTVHADLPSSPASPKPIRNTLLGLLAGLALGLVAAFLRDALDRRFRSVHEIKDELGLPLLGHVRDDVLGRSIGSSNGRGLTGPELEAFRIVRTNVDFLDADRPVTTMVVTSARPEEGKTTVAGALAFTYAAAGRRTLLVECDLRRPTLAGRLGLDQAPGLSDYLVGAAEPADVLQTAPVPAASEIVSTNGGSASPVEAAHLGLTPLVCICAGTPTPRPAELLGSARFKEFLANVGESYDIVILDSCPLLSVVDTLELLPSVDGVIFCLRASRTTRDQARAGKAALQHFPDRPTGIVVTGVRAGDDSDYGYYGYAYVDSKGT